MIYPIISYYLSNAEIARKLPQLPKQLYVQVYLSAPVLFFLGLFLFFRFKQKVIGLLFSLIGAYWFCAIIYELITKE